MADHEEENPTGASSAASGDDARREIRVEDDLRRIAHMFGPFRDDPIMRELCRLALKSARERWIA